MSEPRYAITYERDSSATQDFKRIRSLSRYVREGYAKLGLHAAYQLFTRHPFKGLISPPETEEGRARRMERCPVYPERKPMEQRTRYEARLEEYEAKYATYRRFAEDYVAECVEKLVEEVERLNSHGEFFPEPQQSSLQQAEGWRERCSLDVFTAKVLRRDWKALLPPEPVSPPRTQLSLF